MLPHTAPSLVWSQQSSQNDLLKQKSDHVTSPPKTLQRMPDSPGMKEHVEVLSQLTHVSPPPWGHPLILSTPLFLSSNSSLQLTSCVFHSFMYLFFLASPQENRSSKRQGFVLLLFTADPLVRTEHTQILVQSLTHQWSLENGKNIGHTALKPSTMAFNSGVK